jgi:hypothetical protein
MRVKWVEVGNSECGPQYFVVPHDADVSPAALARLSEDQLGDIVICQAQTSEWAMTIVSAMNRD